ncbi:MAG: acetate uptake transporter family protein [Myxococcaceae bacterium]
MNPTASAAPPPPVFGEPTPLGLLGLAIGCAALVPIAFGWLPQDPGKVAVMLKTAAWFCLLFGGGCQFLSGIMCLANKNTLGGTLLTTFSFNWIFNWWVLDQASQGKGVDASVGLAVDVAFVVIFVVLTYAFGFFSKLLFLFLLDIDALYLLRIAKHFSAPGGDAFNALGVGVGLATVALAGLALYISFAMLVNPVAGRAVFPIPGPLFKPASAVPAKSAELATDS